MTADARFPMPSPGPAALHAPGVVRIEPALTADLPAIITILGEGQMTANRDRWDDASAGRYRAAFAEITGDPNAELLVARDPAGSAVLGVMHLVHFRALGSAGTRRLLINALFVAASHRGRGIGGRLLAEAEAHARGRGAGRIDLLSNKARLDAHRFYRERGYEQGSEGFKKFLAD